MHAGDAQAVPGHPDVADEPLVAGPGQRLDGAAGPVGDLPLVRLDEVVQLDQIDMVDVHALQRPLQLGAGGVALPLAGLGGQEHRVPVVGQPRLQTVLRAP